jgi:DNA-binding beta-propeller fold protein YncE
MGRRHFAGVAAALWAVLAGSAQASAPLDLERTLPLPRVAGRIDHLAFDPRHLHLLVAEHDNGSLDVLDATSGRGVGRIAGLPGPQGVAYAPGPDAIVVANGGDGTVRFFRADTLAPLGQLMLGADADDIAPGPDGTLVVGYGDGALAVIDPAARRVTATVALPAHPEAFRIDAAAARVFVNLPDAGGIDLADLRTGRILAAWRTPGLRDNFPMALLAPDGALAVGFRAPARVALLAAADGRILAQAPACTDTDDLFADRRRGLLYLSCGAGVVDVVRRDGNALLPLARIPTAPGARTALFVPALDRLFVAAPASADGTRPAAILVLRPAP